MYNKLPKTLRLAMLIIKGIDIPKAIELINNLVYLWREFYIRVKITPVVQKYKVSFYYKDERLCGTDVTDLKEIGTLIEDIKKMRSE